MPRAAVELIAVSKQFEQAAALRSVCLSVQEGELLCLLGPSGCGKTTLLRIVAGLELPDSGTVRIAGQDVRQVSAHRRPVNTVFQSYALFPHLNVRENVAFGLRMKKMATVEMERRAAEVMQMVQISELAQRKPSQLSGGQKQRVALARAVVNEPQVLLLDEPLGALDFQLRQQLQTELRCIQRRLGITFIHVTHDREEALFLGDRIAVMQAGQISQLGPPSEVYEQPRCRFVAEFMGDCNFFTASLVEDQAGKMRFESQGNVWEVPLRESSAQWQRHQRVTLAIRPEKVRLAAKGGGANGNSAPGTVLGQSYRGPETHYEIETPMGLVKARAANELSSMARLKAGQPVVVHFPPESLIVLND